MWTKLDTGIAAMAVSGCAVGSVYQASPKHAWAGWSSPVASELTDSATGASSWWTSFKDVDFEALYKALGAGCEAVASGKGTPRASTR